MTSWQGWFVPAGTPREVVGIIQRAAAKALTAPDLIERLRVGGNEGVGSTPEEFEARFKADLAKFAKIVKKPIFPCKTESPNHGGRHGHSRSRICRRSRKSLEDWTSFGTKFLGMQLIDRSAKSLALRMDDRKQRVVVSEDGGEGVGFFGWEVRGRRHARSVRRQARAAGVKVARGTRALADERRVKDLIVLADPLGNRLEVFHGAETTSRAVPARPQHFRLPHRAARHGPCGAARQGHQRRGAVLSRRARLPAVRLHGAAVQRLFLSRQSAPPLDRLHRDRPQRHPPPDGRALQPRRRRAVLRPGARRGRPHRHDARAPHQRRGHLVLFALAVRIHGRVRLGRARHRRRQLADRGSHLGPQHVGSRPHVAAAGEARRGARAAHPRRLHRPAQAGQRDRGQLQARARRLPVVGRRGAGEAAE